MLPELESWEEPFGYAGEPDTCATRYQGQDNSTIELTPGATVSNAPYTREDVKEIYLLIEGENDGPEWIGVFLLNDGRFVALHASCDYTGWDCRAWGVAIAGNSLHDIAIMGLSVENRRRALTNEPSIIHYALKDMLLEIADESK